MPPPIRDVIASSRKMKAAATRIHNIELEWDTPPSPVLKREIAPSSTPLASKAFGALPESIAQNALATALKFRAHVMEGRHFMKAALNSERVEITPKAMSYSPNDLIKTERALASFLAARDILVKRYQLGPVAQKIDALIGKSIFARDLYMKEHPEGGVLFTYCKLLLPDSAGLWQEASKVIGKILDSDVRGLTTGRMASLKEVFTAVATMDLLRFSAMSTPPMYVKNESLG